VFCSNSKNCRRQLRSTIQEKAGLDLFTSTIFSQQLRRDEETLTNIKQYLVRCPSNDKKYEALINLYGVLSVGQAIFFCHTRKTALWLARKMNEDKFPVALLTGELDVGQRASILKRSLTLFLNMAPV